jgi:hypothetical protein
MSIQDFVAAHFSAAFFPCPRWPDKTKITNLFDMDHFSVNLFTT